MVAQRSGHDSLSMKHLQQSRPLFVNNREDTQFAGITSQNDAAERFFVAAVIVVTGSREEEVIGISDVKNKVDVVATAVTVVPSGESPHSARDSRS